MRTFTFPKAPLDVAKGELVSNECAGQLADAARAIGKGEAVTLTVEPGSDPELAVSLLRTLADAVEEFRQESMTDSERASELDRLEETLRRSGRVGLDFLAQHVAVCPEESCGLNKLAAKLGVTRPTTGDLPPALAKFREALADVVGPSVHVSVVRVGQARYAARVEPAMEVPPR